MEENILNGNVDSIEHLEIIMVQAAKKDLKESHRREDQQVQPMKPCG